MRANLGLWDSKPNDTLRSLFFVRPARSFPTHNQCTTGNSWLFNNVVQAVDIAQPFLSFSFCLFDYALTLKHDGVSLDLYCTRDGEWTWTLTACSLSCNVLVLYNWYLYLSSVGVCIILNLRFIQVADARAKLNLPSRSPRWRPRNSLRRPPQRSRMTRYHMLNLVIIYSTPR